MQKQDNTTAEGLRDIVQTGIRIPVDMHKTVAKMAIDREISASEIWIDAMRRYLKLPFVSQWVAKSE